MPHFNPQACKDYCCFQCSGRLDAYCGLSWTTSGAINARVVNADYEEIGQGLIGNVQNVPPGEYVLQVQCANGADWTDADTATIVEETECTCCEFVQKFSTVTISGVFFPGFTDPSEPRSLRQEPLFRDLLPCLALPDSYNLPLFSYTRICNDVVQPNSEPFPGFNLGECRTFADILWQPHTACHPTDGVPYFFANRSDVIAKACRTETIDSIQHWIALSYGQMYIIIDHNDPTPGTINPPQVSVSLFFTLAQARSDLTGPSDIQYCYILLKGSLFSCPKSSPHLTLSQASGSFCSNSIVFWDGLFPSLQLTLL
jgi:hypothetical protein